WCRAGRRPRTAGRPPARRPQPTPIIECDSFWKSLVESVSGSRVGRRTRALGYAASRGRSERGSLIESDRAISAGYGAALATGWISSHAKNNRSGIEGARRRSVTTYIWRAHCTPLI